jgi:predicted aldo/keto reductase-like oxidoreductase
MRYRKDRQGNELSVLGYGCMRFPRDPALTERLVVSAIARGVNYLDTAYLYDDSETTLGRILEERGLRDRVFLTSKLPFKKCHSSADFDTYLDETLARLRTDRLDYYLVHSISSLAQWQRLQELGIERWFDEQRRRGRIGQVGFSFHGAQDQFMALLEAYDWDLCQIQYNYMNEGFQAGSAGLYRAAERGLPVIAMEPLLGGKLARNLPEAGARALAGLAVPTQEQEAALSPAWSPAQWALAWVLDHAEVTLALSGMNAPTQLDENLHVAAAVQAGFLSEQDREAFRQAAAAIQAAYKVPCTGCNYCMPCPQGVNIPACFESYNMRAAMGLYQGYHMYLTSTSGNDRNHNAGASGCVHCGACVEKCPQGIAIPERLDEVRRKMEPGLLKALLRLLHKFY